MLDNEKLKRFADPSFALSTNLLEQMRATQISLAQQLAMPLFDVQALVEASRPRFDYAVLFQNFSISPGMLEIANLQRTFSEAIVPNVIELARLYDFKSFVRIAEDVALEPPEPEENSESVKESIPDMPTSLTIPRLVFRIGFDIISKLLQDPREIHNIDDRQFEILVADIFDHNGFEVELTQATRDGGKDIIAKKVDDLGVESEYLIECKKYAPENKVGIAAIQRLHGVVNARRSNAGIVVTTSTFSKDAKKWASELNMTLQLKDCRDIARWIRNLRV